METYIILVGECIVKDDEVKLGILEESHCDIGNEKFI